MWKVKEKAPICEFIIWTYVLWLVSGTISYLLESYSVLMMETGKLTWQYILYAFVGICFSTPGPMIAL